MGMIGFNIELTLKLSINCLYHLAHLIDKSTSERWHLILLISAWQSLEANPILMPKFSCSGSTDIGLIAQNQAVGVVS